MRRTSRRGTRAPRGMRWVALNALSEAALPSVMRKVISHHVGQRSVTGNDAHIDFASAVRTLVEMRVRGPSQTLSTRLVQRWWRSSC